MPYIIESFVNGSQLFVENLLAYVGFPTLSIVNHSLGVVNVKEKLIR